MCHYPGAVMNAPCRPPAERVCGLASRRDSTSGIGASVRVQRVPDGAQDGHVSSMSSRVHVRPVRAHTTPSARRHSPMSNVPCGHSRIRKRVFVIYLSTPHVPMPNMSVLIAQ